MENAMVSAPLFGRIVLVALLAVMLWYAVLVVLSGRHMAKEGRLTLLQEEHVARTTGLLCTNLCMLVWLELIIRIPAFETRPVSPDLLAVHIPLAIVSFALFLAVKFIPSLNGQHNPALHRTLVRTGGLLFIAVLATGISLAHQMW